MVMPAVRPIIAMPDSALLKGCNIPVLLPNKPLTQALVEKLWISDRQALIECGRRHKALGDFIKKQREGLS
ncbi:anaerobic dehydrogenase [Phyllobacterium sp. LjRoot231]|uniref:anaerobic dehydrogenase n=1 Tax=Phyllobacterium sp. LjRoot231 TaxID=3342289 RepID=UPI003F4F8BAD